MSRKLLLVSPAFHGYWKSIQRAFTELGYEVDAHPYDAAPKWEKAWNKVRHELPARLRGQRAHLSPEVVTQRAIAAVRASRPDIVLVVRGDVLLPSFWDAVRDSGAESALWLYDELRRMSYDPVTVGELGRIASYSPGDVASLKAAGVEAIHVPDAYDPAVLPTPRPDTGDFSFIGARFPRRTEYLEALVSAGLPVLAVGRDWSSHPYDRLRTFRLGGAGTPWARDIPLADAYGVMRGSLATLNIHGDQDGFTMRTFEAPGVGGVQLCDREDVAQFYEPGREVLVFDDPDSLVRLCRDVMSSPHRMAELREAGRRRTLAEHTFLHRARELERLWT